MALNVQCKKCANLRNDWCKLVVDSPDPDMVRDCQYYMGKTNADNIRQMSDEELAQHLRDVANYACPPGKEFTTVVCGKYPDCKKCWLDWLKQEVNDVDFD
jgi:hypothetical protein